MYQSWQWVSSLCARTLIEGILSTDRQNILANLFVLQAGLVDARI